MSVVYIYESCSSVATFSTQKTQVIQSEKVSFTEYPNIIFKDFSGICWRYLGEFQDGYIVPPDVFYITYSGNFFEKDQSLPEIYYPDCESCLLTQVSACTETYFIAEKCDNGENIVVKVCNVGPTLGTIKLTPNVGNVCGITNPYGDDFCVTLKSITTEQQTEYVISTPGWETYNCIDCPIYKVYSVTSFEGLTQNLMVNTPITQSTIENGTIVNLNVDKNCFLINSYEGIKINFQYNENITPTVNEIFTTSGGCLNNFYTI